MLQKIYQLSTNDFLCHYKLYGTVKCECGWDTLKSPLLTVSARCLSRNVEKYCTFLRDDYLCKAKINDGNVELDSFDVQ